MAARKRYELDTEVVNAVQLELKDENLRINQINLGREALAFRFVCLQIEMCGAG